MSNNTNAYKIKGTISIPKEFNDLIDRRTKPFLNYFGISTRPISFLLKEAYLQGLHDAIDAMQAKEEKDAILLSSTTPSGKT